MVWRFIKHMQQLYEMEPISKPWEDTEVTFMHFLTWKEKELDKAAARLGIVRDRSNDQHSRKSPTYKSTSGMGKEYESQKRKHMEYKPQYHQWFIQVKVRHTRIPMQQGRNKEVLDSNQAGNQGR